MTKTNWELDSDNRDKLGMRYGPLSEELFDWLRKKSFEAKEIDSDATENLAGHLNQEYFIKSNQPYQRDCNVDNDENFLKFQDLLCVECFKSPLSQFSSSNYILTENRKLAIASLWTNFQRKHEFNPPHVHGGLYSFIVFVNIPYELENELRIFKNGNVTSKLYFQTQAPLYWNRSGILRVDMNVDKSYEGKMIIFPANLQHGVFPFFTSEDYRITISGNLVFKV